MKSPSRSPLTAPARRTTILSTAKLPMLKVISVAPLMADAIRRIHGNESISDLFRDEGPAKA